MGKQVFVSYKYSDNNVYPLPWVNAQPNAQWPSSYQETTVRHYVDELQAMLEADDHINKGEKDDESLANFKESTIASKLRDKIYNSSITIVMISPNMKDGLTPESDQWIPWEIAYSLREATREDRTSRTNAVLAVVLPDRNNTYTYYLEDKTCCSSNCRLNKTETLFQILRENMFNIKNPSHLPCQQNSKVFTGEPSYIPAMKWYEFKTNVNTHLERVIRINENIQNYEIVKTIR
jgi:MTH538 TIR-like domain (DUF1863)